MNTENTALEHELGWDDTITKDSNEFILLPEGEYNFTVESFDRGRHNGSEKLPPCNKAILKIRISSPQGEVTLTHNLFLHTITEGMLSSFFEKEGRAAAHELDVCSGLHRKIKVRCQKLPERRRNQAGKSN